MVRDAVRGVCEYLSDPHKWVVVLDSREKLPRTCVQDMHCIFAVEVRGFCESQGFHIQLSRNDIAWCVVPNRRLLSEALGEADRAMEGVFGDVTSETAAHKPGSFA